MSNRTGKSYATLLAQLNAILPEVVDELCRAQALHPEWPEDPVHAAGIVIEEAGELMQACLDKTYGGKHADKVRAEAIQTTAMGLRFLLNYKE